MSILHQTGEEQWRSIEDFPEYEVSTLGRVRRVARGRGAVLGRVLKPGRKNNGYLNVTLCRDGRHHIRLVHRLVLAAFLGPDARPCHHLNAIRSDNRLVNLSYVTASENHRHTIAMGRRPPLRPACSRGHPYTPDNTYVGQGRRHCRACRRIMMRQQYWRRRGVTVEAYK